MTEPPVAESSPVTLADLAARLEDLTREVRRQARAAVATQAAAESCLEKLVEREGARSEDGGEDEDEPEIDTAWVSPLLPVADALDRVVAQANALVDRAPSPPRSPPAKPSGLLAMFSRAPAVAADASRDASQDGIRALAEGLRVLRAQLGAALESSGVTIDRRVGVAVDPEIHRVVETRALRPGEREGVVLEVVRPGYAAHGRVIREAEVVAARPRPGKEE